VRRWSHRRQSGFRVDVWRGSAGRDVGVRRRVSAKSPRQQPPAIGASSEGRLAWPLVPHPSGHLCKAPRPLNARVAFRRAPFGLVELLLEAQRDGDDQEQGEASEPDELGAEFFE